jgi:hypothetical protein
MKNENGTQDNIVDKEAIMSTIPKTIPTKNQEAAVDKSSTKAIPIIRKNTTETKKSKEGESHANSKTNIPTTLTFLFTVSFTTI